MVAQATRERLTERLDADTLDGAIDAVEAWKNRHPDWVVTDAHYFATSDLMGRLLGYGITVEAVRVQVVGIPK